MQIHEPLDGTQHPQRLMPPGAHDTERSGVLFPVMRAPVGADVPRLLEPDVRLDTASSGFESAETGDITSMIDLDLL